MASVEYDLCTVSSNLHRVWGYSGGVLMDICPRLKRW
jgi:hypothetical protein